MQQKQGDSNSLFCQATSRPHWRRVWLAHHPQGSWALLHGAPSAEFGRQPFARSPWMQMKGFSYHAKLSIMPYNAHLVRILEAPILVSHSMRVNPQELAGRVHAGERAAHPKSSPSFQVVQKEVVYLSFQVPFMETVWRCPFSSWNLLHWVQPHIIIAAHP